MVENRCLLDANAILRFLLQDIEEQFQQIQAIVRNKNSYVTLEVLSEVCYVLEGLYQVSREDITQTGISMLECICIDMPLFCLRSDA